MLTVCRGKEPSLSGCVIVPSWGDGVVDVILDTVHETLVTPPGIGYRRAHVDARRGFWGNPDAGRGGGRDLVAPHGGAGVRAARLAVAVRTGACPRGEGTGAGGHGGSTRGTAAPGRGGFPFPCGFAEVADRHLPEQAEGGRRGDEGGPACVEGRAVLPGGSGAAGKTPFGSRRRVEQAQHDRVATHGGRPAAHGLAGVAGPERFERAAVRRERPAAQVPGAVAGPEGRERGVAQGGRGAAQGATHGAGIAVQGERPAGQGAGAIAGAEGGHQVAARASRLPEPGDPSAVPEAGVVADPQGHHPPAVRRDRSTPREGEEIGSAATYAPGPLRTARPVEACPGESRARHDGAGERACQASCEQGGAAPAAQGPEEVAAPEDHDPVAAQGECPAGQGGEGVAGPDREAGRAACQASRDWDRVVEGALRPQERAAGEATLQAPCTALPRGCPTRGWRSRRGRWPTL